MSNKFSYFKNLQAKLDERRCQIMESSWKLFPQELKFFIKFLENQTLTKTIIYTLGSMIEKNDFSGYHFGGRGLGGGHPDLPTDEDLKTAFYFKILNGIDENSFVGILSSSNVFMAGGSKLEDFTQNFKEQIFLPFYRYIFDKVSDGDFLLYLLYRFKFNIEWFDKQRLYEIYQNNSKEEILDIELRKFLFTEGIDYPYSTPKTASGRPDIVLHVEEKPLPLEVKVFDPERGYGKERIIKGFYQAKRYADDYAQHLGYLAIFNPSLTYLELKGNTTLPSLAVGSKEIIGLVIDINPNRPTASKETKIDREVVTDEDLK